MAAADALVCPACGARNKPKWEYCVRCGESLQDAVTVPTLAKTQVSRKGKPDIQIHEEEAGSSIPAGLIVVVGVVIVGGLAVAGWRYASRAPELERPDPGLFTIPTQPSARPVPPAVAEGPGATDYEEGRKLFSQGRAADALPFLSRAASAAPSNALFQWIYGQAQLATGAADDAFSSMSTAARLNPGEYLLQLGQALDRAGRPAEAASAYEEALQTEPGNAGLQEELGRIYYKAGDFTKAAPLLEKAAQARSADPVLRQELAYAVEKTGDKARAAQLYREVLGQAPGADVSRGRLADILLEQGKADEAVAVLREGVQRDPNLPGLRRDLGNALEQMGKTEDAIREYREYARLAPNAPDAKELAERAARLEGAGKS